jgi:hypothetical protein
MVVYLLEGIVLNDWLISKRGSKPYIVFLAMGA